MRTRAGLLCALLILGPLFSFAQSLEDDDPNDRRYWGYSSRYSSQVGSLGSARIESLTIPVLLGVEVDDLTRNFGDARGGGTRTHQGLDIMAPEWTPIASPTDAVVLRVGNGTNSGLYVRTANPGGENFVYMHLVAIANGIEAGRSVGRGEIIGFVGNTGNASGGPAHLHLEVRSGGTATDPFLRLTQVFTLSERMQGAAQALERTNNSSLASVLATKFRSTFALAQSQGVTVPSAIAALLPASGSPPAPAPNNPTPSANSYKQTLVFGETNADVRALQQFLIANPKGSSGTRLKNTGVTGYFGPLTKAALMEYQTAAGIPPSGVVDAATYTLVFGQADEDESLDTGSAGFSRDLELGMSGADVRMLQVFLNTKGFVVAESGAGSPGNESDYFGARTQAALAKYQAANGISPAAGYFGPKTRAQITL